MTMAVHRVSGVTVSALLRGDCITIRATDYIQTLILALPLAV